MPRRRGRDSKSSPNKPISRRYSLPESGDIATLKKLRELKSANLPPKQPKPLKLRSSSQKKYNTTLSEEDIRSSYELFEEIQRETTIWVSCDENYINYIHRNSDASKEQTKQTKPKVPAEQVQTSVATQTEEAEVHQSDDKTGKVPKNRIRNRTQSHESVIKEPAEIRALTKRPNFSTEALEKLRLLASSKLVNQSAEKSAARARSYSLPVNSIVYNADEANLNAISWLFSREDERAAPPSPAPADPHELGGTYSDNVFLGIPPEPSRQTGERHFSDSDLSGFLLYDRRNVRPYEGTSLIGSLPNVFGPGASNLTRFSQIPWSLHYPYRDTGVPQDIASFAERFPDDYRVVLPRVDAIYSSGRQQHFVSSPHLVYPNVLNSYIAEPPRQSILRIPEDSLDYLYQAYINNKTIPEQSERSFERHQEFDLEFSNIRFHELPDEYFKRAIEERFLERHPRPFWPISPRFGRRARSPPPDRHLTTSPSSSVIDYLEFMRRMNLLEDHERKIIIEFCHLLEKSKQLFNGLRELPQYGHKQWHSYFGRTFDVYTKLWKFQQQHRIILDSKYGLKRWQIGEIASKIGQLYYHFYLRTSETAYLNEAYSFYYAIRGRSYYTQASKADRCELMVKKLRYYARFIVASILLKKVKLVRELIKELDRQIIEYGNTYNPDDQNEWKIVAEEVRTFLKAEPVVAVVHPDDYAVILTHRLTPQSTPPVERSAVMNLSLQEALIVGSNSAQVKFSELTMDMFRMMQTLEREPNGDIQHMYDDSPRQRYISNPSAVNNKGYNIETCSSRSESPHKYLLFEPTPNQIFVYLASACDDLPSNGVVLLYISAEGLIVPPLKHPEDASGFDIGGLITTSRTDVAQKEAMKDGKPATQKHKEIQVLHPGDLYPFTRRPMFLIIDSDNSFIFHDLPRYFGQPLVILMSPVEQPSSLYPTAGDRRAEGSLFTLFLHCPLSAFCFCCNITTMSLGQWERAQTFIDTYLAEASQIITRSRIDNIYLAFMGDDFLRLLILRFIFCETFLRMHRLFRGRNQCTRASPPLPDDLYEHPGLTHIVIDLAAHFQVRGHFHDPAAVPPPPTNRE